MGWSLLVDGYGWAKAFDVIDVRFLHLPQKLARIGRKRLYVATLAFSVYRVESQRAFPRPGDTGDNHQFVPGDDHVYIFEVVLPGALDKYGIGHDALIVALVLVLLKRGLSFASTGVHSEAGSSEFARSQCQLYYYDYVRRKGNGL